MLSDMVHVLRRHDASLLTIIMFLVLRSWHGVVFTMFVVMCTVSVTYGLMTLAASRSRCRSASIMPLLTAIGMEYSVYVAFAYQHAVQTGPQDESRSAALARPRCSTSASRCAMSAACAAAAFGIDAHQPARRPQAHGTWPSRSAPWSCCSRRSRSSRPGSRSSRSRSPPKDKCHHRRLQALIDRIGRLVDAAAVARARGARRAVRLRRAAR